MPIVEKNDVDISRLFSWSKEVVISGLKGKDVKIYLRLLGDADINRARVAALRSSAELRKALRNTESDDRLAYIPYKEELSKELLVESIIILTMRELTKQTMNDVVLPRPKDPGSNASTERLERFQKEVDEYPKKREEAIRSSMETVVTRRREELNAQDEDRLYSTYVNVLINELCEQELIKRFKEYNVFFGSYSDKKLTQRFFEDFETFDNLPTEVKSTLIDSYSSLELESDELKK